MNTYTAEQREQAAVRVVNVINSCRTLAHVAGARAMVERFEAMYDNSLPLRRWLAGAEFEIKANTGFTAHACRRQHIKRAMPLSKSFHRG